MEEKQTNNTTENTKNQSSGKSNKILTIVGIVLCVILLPLLIGNIILIVDSYVHKDRVPSLFGAGSPMIVLTDSMDPTIKSGDLIIVKTVKTEDLTEGDIVSFFDPESKNRSVVTHRIKEVVKLENGKTEFVTRGDNNDTDDKLPVPEGNIVGLYKFRIPKMGKVAMFMQTTPGLIVCVALPILLLVGYDFLRRKNYERAKARDTEALLREINELKAQQNAGATNVQPTVDNAVDNANDNTDDNPTDEKTPET